MGNRDFLIGIAAGFTSTFLFLRLRRVNWRLLFTSLRNRIWRRTPERCWAAIQDEMAQAVAEARERPPIERFAVSAVHPEFRQRLGKLQEQGAVTADEVRAELMKIAQEQM